MNIKKNDNVIVISGKDKGKTGKIVRAIPKEGKVLIAGVNVKKVHKKAKKGGQKGQIMEKPMPIFASSVMIVDPSTGKRTRIGKKLVDGRFVRVSKKSDTILK